MARRNRKAIPKGVSADTPDEPQAGLEVFCSYSHEDEQMHQKLQKHLSVLRRQGTISTWNDRKICPGDDWRGQIHEHLNSADIILLLISSDFLASDYCYDIEAGLAMERHERGEARVIPVILRPALWHETTLGKLQALPKDGKPIVRWTSRDDAYVDVVRGIRDVARELAISKQVTPSRLLASAPTYSNFDIVLAGPPIQPSYSVVPISELGFRTKSVKLDLSYGEIDELSTLVKTGYADKHTARLLGTALFKVLFSYPILKLWRARQERLRSPNQLLRLRLDIRNKYLSSLPWEMINDGEFLAMAPQRPIVRYIYGLPTAEPTQCISDLNILLVATATSDCIAPATNHAEVETVFDRVSAAIKGSGRLTTLPRLASTRQLVERLQGGKYHILHYIGNAEFRDGAERLLMEDEQGHLVGAKRLAQMLGDTPLPLVVLSPYRPTSPSQIDSLSAVAYDLLDAGVPAVVVIRGMISDNAAHSFTSAFYSELAQGHQLEWCVTVGRTAILDNCGPDRIDWAMPALFSNIQTGLLWLPRPRTSAARPAPASPAQVWTGSRQNVANVFERAASWSIIDGRRPTTREVKRTRHNLPRPDHVSLVGRDDEVNHILEKLLQCASHNLVSITGPTGSGRSALAREVARRCLNITPRSLDEPSAFQAIIWFAEECCSTADDLFTVAAQVLDQPIPLQCAPRNQLELLRQALHTGWFLLILDDMDTMPRDLLLEVLRHLPSSVRILCTSRMPLKPPAPLTEYSVSIAGLSPDSSMELLYEDAEARRYKLHDQVSPDVLKHLIQLTNGLPLVLRWAAGRLREDELEPQALLEQLERADDTDLANCCLRDTLRGLVPPVRDLLMLLAVYPRPVQREIACTLAGMESKDGLAALTRLGHLECVNHDPNTDAYHVRGSMRRLLVTELDTDSALHETLTTRASEEMMRLASAVRDRSNKPAARSLARELGNVMWAVRVSHALGDWHKVLEFNELLKDFCFERGYWREGLKIGRWAYDAADRLGDHKRRAWCALHPIGRLYFHIGDYDAAEQWCNRSLALFKQQHDDYGVAAAERYAGRVMERRGNFDRAHELFTDALSKSRQFNSRPEHWGNQGDLVASLAGLAEMQGKWDTAKHGYEEALALQKRIGNKMGIATILERLGNVAARQGKLQQAVKLLNEGLSIAKESGWEYRIASIHYSQAMLAEIRGDLEKAQTLLLHARDRFYRLGDSAETSRIDAALTRVSATTVRHSQQQSDS